MISINKPGLCVKLNALDKYLNRNYENNIFKIGCIKTRTIFAIELNAQFIIIKSIQWIINFIWTLFEMCGVMKI